MRESDFHPFLESHEIPNKKEIETSQQESIIEVADKKSEKKFERPFDKKPSLPFHKASFVSFKEIHAANDDVGNFHEDSREPENFRVFNAAKQKILLHNHPAIRENQRLHEEAERIARREQNKKLLRSGDTEKIIKFLQEDKVMDFEFAKEIEKTKQEYALQLADATFLNQKHWKLLTSLRIFSKETFEHSVGTFLILKKAITEMPELQNQIIEEGVTIEQFLWAGLAHDSGKIAIPKFILDSHTTDREWAIGLAMLDEEEKDEIFIKIFYDKGFVIPDEAKHEPEKLAEILEEKRIRAVEYVPIKTILTSDEIETMSKIGLDANTPLKKIMAIHEKKSEEVLKNLGFVIEGMLAGHHHDCSYVDKKLGEKPASLSALHIGIEISSTIIHLADVQHAMSGERSYHHKQPKLRILAFLVDDALKGKIMPQITALWLQNELSKMSPGYLNEIRNMDAKHQDPQYLKQRNEELELIEEFILDNLSSEKSNLPGPKSFTSQSELQYADNYDDEHLKRAV